MNGSGTLSIHGGNTDNNLTIIENLGHVQITDNTDSSTANFNGVTAVSIMGNVGHDTVLYKNNSVGATINGDSGDDYLIVADEGTGSSDVEGGAGNDLV